MIGKLPMEKPIVATSWHDDSEAFQVRGEAAWQDYLRTGVSASADDVLARLQEALDAKGAAIRNQAEP